MKKNKTFTIICITSPIIGVYQIMGLPIMDILLALCYIPLLVKLFQSSKNIRATFYLPLLIPLLYTVLQLSFLMFFDYTYAVTLVSKTFHNIFYLVTIILFVPFFTDVKTGMKVYKFLCIFSSIYVIVQLLLVNTINYYLPGTLPFFETVVDEFNTSIIASNMDVRPRSIFSEPAAYGTFIAIYLAIDLLENHRYEKKNLVINILCTVGVLSSRTSTGILLCALVWAAWGVQQFLNLPYKRKMNFLICFIVILPLIVFGISRTESFEIFIEHTFTNSGTLMGSGMTGRVGNYQHVFGTEMSHREFWFGHGMIDPGFYIPGVPRLFYYFGLVGMFAWGFTYLLVFIKSKLAQRRVLIVVIISAFFGDTLFGMSTVSYFSLIIMLKDYGTDNNMTLKKACKKE